MGRIVIGVVGLDAINVGFGRRGYGFGFLALDPFRDVRFLVNLFPEGGTMEVLGVGYGVTENALLVESRWPCCWP